MSERALVTGYGWRDGIPVLRVRLGQRTATWSLSGEVHLEVTAERRCPGFQGVEGPEPCPDSAVPDRRQCRACEQRDTFRPCMTCDGLRCPPLTPRMQRYCQDTHVLYLAHFGSPPIKVGTAVHRRRDQRLVEQGPLAAVRVAQGPGPSIKQMEACLVRQDGFVEAMRRTRKEQLLASGTSAEEARTALISLSGGLAARVPKDLVGLLHEPDPYHAPEMARRARGWSVQRLPVEPGTRIRGRLAGAIGHLAFLEDTEGRFAVDLGDLRTRMVIRNPSGEGRRPVVQLGMF